MAGSPAFKMKKKSELYTKKADNSFCKQMIIAILASKS